MKYSIGYQLPDEYDSILEIARDFQDHISSVYFSGSGQASARSVIESEYQEEMMQELREIRNLGISLTMLYNANCYGDKAVSTAFQDEIIRSTGSMIDSLEISSITTTSPFVAKVIKREFPSLSVCASVNMWIGSEQAMKYLGDDFDAFYLQREYNRDIQKIIRLSTWCSRQGKELKLLANSGCFYTCPFHTFHDNLVAHEEESHKTDNAMSQQPSPCWDRMYSMRELDSTAAFLQSSWIRPEDIPAYEPYFSDVKLATRMHSNPRRVVSAYVMSRFSGNLFDLTEPSFSRRFKDHILDATKLPTGWFLQTTNCSRNCDECGYCRKVAEKALVSKSDLEKMYLSS